MMQHAIAGLDFRALQAEQSALLAAPSGQLDAVYRAQGVALQPDAEILRRVLPVRVEYRRAQAVASFEWIGSSHGIID